jgi:hypothetical protein
MNHTLDGISDFNEVEGYIYKGRLLNAYSDEVLIFELPNDGDVKYASIYTFNESEDIEFETRIQIKISAAIALGMTTQQEVDKKRAIAHEEALERTTKYQAQNIIKGIKHLKETGMSPRDITKLINEQ